MTETFHPTYALPSTTALPTWFYACLVCEETRLEGTPLFAWILVGDPLCYMPSIGLVQTVSPAPPDNIQPADHRGQVAPRRHKNGHTRADIDRQLETLF